MFDIKENLYTKFFTGHFFVKRIYSLYIFGKPSNHLCDVSLKLFSDVLRKESYIQLYGQLN